jgi:4-amino-4-deoxy-L-arabinose transferase-like glycosyltransferase
MVEVPRFRLADWLFLVAVLAVAAGTRAWYLSACADTGRAPAPLQVQGASPPADYPPGSKIRDRDQPTELDALVHNLVEYRWYGSLAPLADKEEKTAHRAPGYPWLCALVARWLDDADMVVRWIQCGLGALTAAFYFLFARRAFRSTLVGLITGVFAVCHPFWIINTAELNDGVLTTFLLGAGLFFGTRGSQDGGPLASLLFGLTMAGLAMVRAALLPFTFVAVLWYLLRCRKLEKGWFGALLAFLGFANGLAPWGVRNYQAFAEPVPVTDSAFWHLWMGNNPLATGGFLDEKTMRKTLAADRLAQLLGETNQARRYGMLGKDVLDEIADDPAATLSRRLWAGLYFVFGESWFVEKKLSLPGNTNKPDGADLPAWLEELYPGLLRGSMLAMLLLGLLGWRWSQAWRRQARLATLAAIWLPLPYLLSHAGFLSGPRLPLDGVLLSYSAFTLACVVPGVRRSLVKGPD